MEEQDYFSLEKIYPDAGKIFSFPYKSLGEVANDCVFVLDTNILLVPFDVSEKDFGVIIEVFEKLKENNRLFIPARVAREFAKNRGEKISKIFLKLRQKQQNLNSGYFSSEKYPILEKSDSFKNLNRLNKKIQQDINRSRKLFKEVESEILSWNWNDPISLAYRRLFTDDIIVEASESPSELISDLDFRIKNGIAPGYKDSAKPDKGIGDLIIWKSVIEIGRKESQNVVFVSNDKKGDWYYKEDKEAIYPKYELFDEFRLNTSGKSINIIDFPKLLEIFKIDENIIKDVKSIMRKESEKLVGFSASVPIDDIHKLYPGLNIGARVIHQNFGEGVVIDIQGGSIRSIIAVVEFENSNIRKLHMGFAKLKFQN